MKSESQAIIFNSALRESEETATYRCFSTFHSSEDTSSLKTSFGHLIFLNDVSLSPQESITYTSDTNTQVMLLPIAGALNYCTGSQESVVKSEQIKIFETGKGFQYSIQNPYEKEWINYLHIGFKVPSVTSSSSLQHIEFKNMNELVYLGSIGRKGTETAGYIGIYGGRSEGHYMLKNPANGVFIYVINGAFEVNGRLLELRDGLSLWNTCEIEFEALSNNAMILLLEIQLA